MFSREVLVAEVGRKARAKSLFERRVALQSKPAIELLLMEVTLARPPCRCTGDVNLDNCVRGGGVCQKRFLECVREWPRFKDKSAMTRPEAVANKVRSGIDDAGVNCDEFPEG